MITIVLAVFAASKTQHLGRWRFWIIVGVSLTGYFLLRLLVDPAIEAIESINPAKAGHIGGLGLPILLSWVVGGIFAAGAAYVIGKASLGLRSDYLAIATLGISEIVVYVLKNEDWLARGVKNVNGLPRLVVWQVCWYPCLRLRLAGRQEGQNYY